MKFNAYTFALKGVTVSTLLSFLMSVPAVAQMMTVEDAVNQAGKQRMITQRMLKDYALVGMNNTYGNPQEDLVKMVALFDANLEELKGFISDKHALASLNEVVTLWKPIKKILQDKPEKKEAADLQRDLESLLRAADKSTNLIAKLSRNSTGEIVNMAGKQRMLSQRMAGLYMLKVWGISDPEFKQKLNNSMDEFAKAQKKLLASPLNTDQINILLKKTKKAYMFFEMIGRSNSKKYIPSLINRSADKILKNMNTVTNLYASK